MITKLQLAGIALCIGAGSATAATCTSPTTKSLGGLGTPDIALFGNSFSKAGSYVDCFSFSLNRSASSFGGVIGVDLLPGIRLNINVDSISLYTGNTSTWQPDTTPSGFSFGGLLGGVVYTLQVASTVTGTPGRYDANVGYGGKIVSVASAAPEPSAYALAIVGLALVGAGVLRSRRR